MDRKERNGASEAGGSSSPRGFDGASPLHSAASRIPTPMTSRSLRRRSDGRAPPPPVRSFSGRVWIRRRRGASADNCSIGAVETDVSFSVGIGTRPRDVRGQPCLDRRCREYRCCAHGEVSGDSDGVGGIAGQRSAPPGRPAPRTTAERGRRCRCVCRTGSASRMAHRSGRVPGGPTLRVARWETRWFVVAGAGVRGFGFLSGGGSADPRGCLAADEPRAQAGTTAQEPGGPSPRSFPDGPPSRIPPDGCRIP